MLWLALTLAATAATPDAPPPPTKRLAILPAIIEGPNGTASAADVFQLVSTAARRELDLDLVAYNELVVDTTIAQNVRNCASDLPCIGSALRAYDIQLGLRAIVNFALDPPLVSLSLIESSPPRLIGESLAELTAGTTLTSALTKESSALIDRAGFVAPGRIVVSVTPKDATIHIEGEPRDIRETDRRGVYLARPGRHELWAEADDHDRAKTTAVVTSGDVVEVALVLAPRETGGITSSAWFWIAIGTVAAAGAATAVVIATDPFTTDPSRGNVCITTPSGDPCP